MVISLIFYQQNRAELTNIVTKYSKKYRKNSYFAQFGKLRSVPGSRNMTRFRYDHCVCEIQFHAEVINRVEYQSFVQFFPRFTYRNYLPWWILK